MIFPFFITPEQRIVFTAETRLFQCDRCPRKDAEITEQRTRYVDECDNYVVLCEMCQKENDAYWDGMWKEYYSSQGLL